MPTTIRNAILADTPDIKIDLAIIDGKIAEIGQNLTPAEDDVDLEGRLIVPGLVESHIHLDKAYIDDRCTIRRGDLPEAVELVSTIKPDFTEDDVQARAERVLENCIANGTMRMRTQLEIDPVIGLRGLRGVQRAIAKYASSIDVEICAFPQEGLTNNEGTDKLLIEALENGATVLGACPYTDTDPKAQMDWVFLTAKDFDLDIDMHLDFSSDISTFDADYVCELADKFGWGGRVAIGHVTKLSFMTPERFEASAKKLAESGVAVSVLPATDLFLMGREYDHAIARGVTHANKLLDHGVNCSLATNNVLNPFTPFGDCSLIRLANLYANIAQIGVADHMSDCLSMITDRAAKLMNLSDYGFKIGNPADFVALDAKTPATAVATIAQPILGYKGGRRTFTHALPQLHDLAPTQQ